MFSFKSLNRLITNKPQQIEDKISQIHLKIANYGQLIM